MFHDCVAINLFDYILYYKIIEFKKNYFLKFVIIIQKN